jgi:hypothetical protein
MRTQGDRRRSRVPSGHHLVGPRMSLRLAGTSLLIALGVVAVPLGSISSAGASGTPGGSSIVSGAAEAGPGVAELGVTPSAAPLQIDVGLEPRDPAALSAFVTSVSTPGSPDYRHYLAKGQFGPMFGPTAATVPPSAAPSPSRG